MPEVTDHAPGMFWWADVMTTDAAVAKRFYQELFGWNATDNPIGDGMSYTMFDKDGKNVCALAEMSPQMQQQVPHPFWQCYVTVADVDAAAAKAAELGGTIAVPPMDVLRRWAHGLSHRPYRRRDQPLAEGHARRCGHHWRALRTRLG